MGRGTPLHIPSPRRHWRSKFERHPRARHPRSAAGARSSRCYYLELLGWGMRSVSRGGLTPLPVAVTLVANRCTAFILQLLYSLGTPMSARLAACNQHHLCQSATANSTLLTHTAHAVLTVRRTTQTPLLHSRLAAARPTGRTTRKVRLYDSVNGLIDSIPCQRTTQHSAPAGALTLYTHTLALTTLNFRFLLASPLPMCSLVV